MKIFSITFLLIFVFHSCSNNTTPSNEKIIEFKNVVSEFIRDVNTLESDTNINPIVSFKELATEISDEILTLNKNNIEDVLTKSKRYSTCVITTGNHTIVKIENLSDCQQSGSWKVCMPKCSGYIKKGQLNYKYDYMNNIIGVPDDQERLAYFFNTIETDLELITKYDQEVYEEAYIQVKSSNQTSSGWVPCNEFYCNNFYLTEHVLDYRPVFTDNKGCYLFFLSNWNSGQWIFSSNFPDLETIDAILNGDLTIPIEDHLCYTNSFDPCGFSTEIINEYGEGHVNFTLGSEYSNVYKELKWVGPFDYMKYKNKMLHDQRIAHKEMYKENFRNLSNKYNETKLLSQNIYYPVPDSTVNESIFHLSNESSFRSTILMYLQENYDLKEDSVYDNSNDRSEEGSQNYWEEADIKEYYYSTNSSKLSNQIEVLISDNIGEMDFDYSCKVIFPNANKQDIIGLLKLLNIYDFRPEIDESFEEGSCYIREVYYGESEGVEVNYDADSTLVEVTHSFNGGGC